MIARFARRKINIVKRWAKKKRLPLSISAIIFVGLVLGYANYMSNSRLVVDPKTYVALLDLIANAESKDNYNAYFGNAANSEVKFTEMSVGEVLAWQSEYIEQGNASSAVGRYQIINTTLNGLVKELGIDNMQKFDEKTQDRMAIALLERRGAEEYVNKELSKEEFAANIAKEWAGLPKAVGQNPNESYYAGDGLNKSLVKVEQVLDAIEPIRP